MKTFVQLLVLAFMVGCSTSVQSPRGGDVDVVQLPVLVADSGTDTSEDVLQTTVPEVAVVDETPPTPPQTLAEKFAAADGAGGMKLCTAMIYALSPDWNLSVCDNIVEDGTGRRERCYRQREPLRKFAEDICKTVIEESLRLDIDPGLPIAVMERESSMGRVRFDSSSGTYQVQTDVCQLYLSASRIIDRKPGRRAGSVLLSWTYAGGTRREVDRPAIILKEDEGGLLIDTCVAGETGLFQLLPSNYRSGTVVAATGKRLTGTTARRREEVIADPVLQVRLGCQQLDRHRNMFPEEQRGDWFNWLHSYNTGRIEQGSQGRAYTIRVAGHYLQACRYGWFERESANSSAADTVRVADVWPECARVESAREALLASQD